MVCFWNDKSDNKKPMLVQWIVVSHRVGIALYYWIIIGKGKFLSCAIVHRLTSYKSRDTNVQELICNYHGVLECVLGSEYFGASLGGHYSFINDNE